MIAIDDLLATIPSLQRSDLEGWIRDELVIAERDAVCRSRTWNAPGSASSAP